MGYPGRSYIPKTTVRHSLSTVSLFCPGGFDIPKTCLQWSVQEASWPSSSFSWGRGAAALRLFESIPEFFSLSPRLSLVTLQRKLIMSGRVSPGEGHRFQPDHVITRKLSIVVFCFFKCRGDWMWREIILQALQTTDDEALIGFRCVGAGNI